MLYFLIFLATLPFIASFYQLKLMAVAVPYFPSLPASFGEDWASLVVWPVLAVPQVPPYIPSDIP